jgi:hypothetical protein
MIYFIHEDQYVIRLKQRIEKSDFIKAGQVMCGSYAEELLGRIYDCLITHSINIIDEYQKYYIEEYPDLESFLYWKYNIDKSTAASIISDLRPGDFLGYGSVYSGGDYNIGQFVREESNLEMVNTLFQH